MRLAYPHFPQICLKLQQIIANISSHMGENNKLIFEKYKNK